jgi:hypothetical protein
LDVPFFDQKNDSEEREVESEEDDGIELIDAISEDGDNID